MIARVLIANRGEIAVRAIRACKNLGIETVAVYSTADRASLHVRLADSAVCIGPPQAVASYLNIPAVLSAAIMTGCDAVYPGYGFLAENPLFAAQCKETGLHFIGPSAQVMELMGNKARARAAMAESGVPVIPGSPVVHSLDEALAAAAEIGFPVMIKASAGGGGKGMRACFSEAEFRQDFPLAKNEARMAFGNDDMYLEKLIGRPRHVEIQVLADQAGHIVAFDERDCSLQRNHQKLVEESPSPFITESVRAAMKKAAADAARAAGYVGAGTVEFIVNEDRSFYFMEMNTRIQVEHPVTELVSGVDLVEWQLRIAAGEALSFTGDDLPHRGHAIECRINAEDPAHKFRSSPGPVRALHLPGGNGVRVDTALYQGYVIPSDYDSLIAKVIVLGETREGALAKMDAALDEMVISGIATNLDFQAGLIRAAAFRSGQADTTFVEEYLRGGPVGERPGSTM